MIDSILDLRERFYKNGIIHKQTVKLDLYYIKDGVPIIIVDDFDRENELLQELIDQFPNCSEMREYHGYSEEEVQEGESEFIEVGTL